MRATLDHFEIPVVDLDRLAAFLEAVFGWVVDEAGVSSAEGPGSSGSDHSDHSDRSTRSSRSGRPAGSSGTRYRRLATAGTEPLAPPSPIRVGLYEGDPGVLDRATPVVRLTGETLEACLARVTSAGGRVVLEPKPIGDTGRFARFEDPEGNPWGLWERSF